MCDFLHNLKRTVIEDMVYITRETDGAFIAALHIHEVTMTYRTWFGLLKYRDATFSGGGICRACMVSELMKISHLFP